MAYSPWREAAKALTSKEAKEFYKQTAIDHTLKTAQVIGMVTATAAIGAVIAGRSFRKVHDEKIVPATRKGFAVLVEKLNPPPKTDFQTEVRKLMDDIFGDPRTERQPHTPSHALPPARERLSKPVAVLPENGVLVTPIPKNRDFPTPPIQHLRTICKDHGLSGAGKKADLLARLES